MKLAISNIAWNDSDEDRVRDVLTDAGVAAIEIAPTRLWPGWQGASREAASQKARALAAQGFRVPALQSLLFERNELVVFAEDAGREALVEHLAFVAGLAAGLGARVMVFGSPRSRDPGDLAADRAHAIAREVFRAVAERCAALDTCLCIEPNPRAYNCGYLTSWREVAAFVAEVDHPGLGLHLDTACISMEGDDVVEAIETCAGRIAHFHVSEPNLADFDAPLLDHKRFGHALSSINYDGYVSIEMRASKAPVDSVRTAVAKVSQWYAK